MKALLCSAAFVAAASPALSASISVTDFSAEAYATAVGGFGATVTEDLESFSEGNVADRFPTVVGTFSTLGGIGSGGSVPGADFSNDGPLLAVRDGNVFGRSSTTNRNSGGTGDGMFLDSNDTYGIRWDVSLGGSLFDAIILTLTDAADVGAPLQISGADAVFSIGAQPNATTQIVSVAFDTAVDSISLFFTNYRRDSQRLNDGFSIDDVTISAVPLPAFSLLLMAGRAVWRPCDAAGCRHPHRDMDRPAPWRS